MSPLTSAGPPVQVVIDGPNAVVTLSRPQRRNALDLYSAHALDDAMTQVEAEPTVRAVILAAEGPAFCAGADLKALAAGEPEAFIADRGWGGVTARTRTKPLIAAVEGPALAGGLELVLASDLVVASTKATFGLPEVRWGLIAAAGGAARLPRRLPPNLAKEILLTGDPIDAKRAQAAGLVNRLVGSGKAVVAAKQLGARIAQNAPLSIAATVQVAEASLAESEAAAATLAAGSLEQLRSSSDCKEGLAAFAAHRLPVWQAH